MQCLGTKNKKLHLLRQIFLVILQSLGWRVKTQDEITEYEDGVAKRFLTIEVENTC